jgi:hypothetical protein
MKKLIILVALTMSFCLAQAHEGHDNVPGAQISKMVPPGQVKATSHMFVELKEEKGTVKVLVFDHDKNDIPTKDVGIVASVKFPRKSKSEKVDFAPVGNMFEAKIDAKNSHRYTIDMTVTHGGKPEKMSFNIEPQQ